MALRTSLGIMLAGVAVIASSAAAAQTGDDRGSALVQTKRDCPPNGAITCPGNATTQRVAERKYAGGAGQSATNTFTATGTGAGSNAVGSVAFGGFGFPDIKASVNALGGVRIGNSLYAYQTYTYAGQEEFDLLLAATFHIVNSSTDGRNGTFAGGAIASAGFAIWDREDFFFYDGNEDYAGPDGFDTAQGLANQPYLFGGSGGGCGAFGSDPGPRASSSADRALTGGEASIAIGQTNCGEETLTLYRGEQFVIASYAQLIANRDGFADATGTFTLGLSPDIGATDAAAFRSGVVLGAVDVAPLSAVPEAKTWAMMIIGLGAVGAALRRARRTRVRFAPG